MAWDADFQKANARLKAASSLVTITQRGQSLYLLGILPDKRNPSEHKQQRLALGLKATPLGLKEAVGIALKVSAELEGGVFEWQNYLNAKQQEELNPVEAFKAYYFTKKPNTPQSQTTWKTRYDLVFRRLPPGKPTEKVCRELLKSYAPERRMRQIIHSVLQEFMTYHKIPYDKEYWASLRGCYGQKGPAKREIPTDSEIETLWEGLKTDYTKQVIGLLATFGLRTSEVFHIDVSPLLEGKFYVVVDDKAKSKKERRAYALPQHWVDKFNLRRPWNPKVKEDSSNKKLGLRVIRIIQRYELPSSYSFRHAYRLRALKLKIDPVIVSRSMGHSPVVGMQHYTRWLDEQDVADAFKTEDK